MRMHDKDAPVSFPPKSSTRSLPEPDPIILTIMMMDRSISTTKKKNVHGKRCQRWRSFFTMYSISDRSHAV